VKRPAIRQASRAPCCSITRREFNWDIRPCSTETPDAGHGTIGRLSLDFHRMTTALSRSGLGDSMRHERHRGCLLGGVSPFRLDPVRGGRPNGPHGRSRCSIQWCLDAQGAWPRIPYILPAKPSHDSSHLSILQIPTYTKNAARQQHLPYNSALKVCNISGCYPFRSQLIGSSTATEYPSPRSRLEFTHPPTLEEVVSPNTWHFHLFPPQQHLCVSISSDFVSILPAENPNRLFTCHG
jgi:hypothetical protein